MLQGPTVMQPHGAWPHAARRSPKVLQGKNSSGRLQHQVQQTPDGPSLKSRESPVLPHMHITGNISSTNLLHQQTMRTASAENIFTELLRRARDDGLSASAPGRDGTGRAPHEGGPPDFQMLAAIQSYSLALMGTGEKKPTTLLGHQFVKQQQSKSHNYRAKGSHRSRKLEETLQQAGYAHDEVAEIKRAVKEQIHANQPQVKRSEMRVVANKNFPMPNLNQFVPIV